MVFLIGVLPGAGATIASFLAYGMERNFVSDEEKEKFGKGSVHGLTAPETANMQRVLEHLFLY